MKLYPVHICLMSGLLFNIPFGVSSQNNQLKIEKPAKTISTDRILEERFIKINGIEQWVTIRGERSKPVILFLHGGPGSPFTPYASAIYGEWEKDFILIQWDQRGAGKTYGRNVPAESGLAYFKSNPLTIEQMIEDGIGLTEYLTKYLGKQRVILFGSSWGSEMGVLMSVKRPDLFCAYVGHSQVVNPSADLVYVYHKLYKMAETAQDQKTMDAFKKLGSPPYDSVQNTGQLFRLVKKYERQNSVAAPESWGKIAPSYDNPKDEQDRSDGDDYSFINYVGDKRFEIKPMMSTINLLNDGLNFKIPVYLLQGEEDILTSKEITKEYFNKIRAPQKEYLLIPKAAHGLNLSVVEMQFKIMKRISCQ